MHPQVHTLLGFFAILLIGSCKGTDIPTPVLLPAHPVYVVCEGALGSGNSALTAYDPDSNTSQANVYPGINGHPIGDIFQSMTRIGDHYFLCVNNSDKVLVIQRNDLKEIGSIAIPKPRYILPFGNTRAYVSTLFSNRLYVINTTSLQVTDTIFMPFKNPEGMLLSGNTAYVCTWDTACNSIYPIDIRTNKAGSPISIAGRAPQEIVQDNEGMLWVLSGNQASGVASYLTRIDPSTGLILQQYAFGTADPLRLVLNNNKDSLYFIEVSYSGSGTNNGLYRMGIHDARLPTQAFVSAKGLQYFWGLDIQPGTGMIYLADPAGFTGAGTVYVYQPDGQLKHQFSSGVGPGHFLFDQ